MPLMIIKATVKCLMSPPHTSNSWTNEKLYICLSSKCVEIDIVINIQIFVMHTMQYTSIFTSTMYMLYTRILYI